MTTLFLPDVKMKRIILKWWIDAKVWRSRGLFPSIRWLRWPGAVWSGQTCDLQDDGWHVGVFCRARFTCHLVVRISLIITYIMEGRNLYIQHVIIIELVYIQAEWTVLGECFCTVLEGVIVRLLISLRCLGTMHILKNLWDIKKYVLLGSWLKRKLSNHTMPYHLDQSITILKSEIKVALRNHVFA